MFTIKSESQQFFRLPKPFMIVVRRGAAASIIFVMFLPFSHLIISSTPPRVAASATERSRRIGEW